MLKGIFLNYRCRNLLGHGRCSRTVFVSISSGRYDLALHGASDFGRLYVPAFCGLVQKQDIFAILKADTWNILSFRFKVSWARSWVFITPSVCAMRRRRRFCSTWHRFM